jgi:hypothetical protein
VRKILLFYAVIILTVFLGSCKEEPVANHSFLITENEIPADLGSIKLNYEPLFEVKYSLRYPFLKVKNDFYFFETNYLQLFRYNLIDGTWKGNFTYSTDEFISTGKYFFTEGDSVVMISYFEKNRSLDIYSINSETLTLKLLKKNLLLPEALSTVFQSTMMFDKNRIIILIHPSDKILTIDLKNFSIKTDPDYHLSGFRHDSSLNSSAIVGKKDREAYLYYYYYKKLFRFNFDTNIFTEIPVPKYLTSIINDNWDKGAIVSNYFCFWPNDSGVALCYDVYKNVWLKAGQNPFYQKSYLPFYCTYDESGTYYQEGVIMQKISIK